MKKRQTKNPADTRPKQAKLPFPPEVMVHILESTGCVRTISRARQACWLLKAVVDGNPSIWTLVEVYTTAFRAEAFLEARGWTALKFVKIAYCWNHPITYAARKVVTKATDVVDAEDFMQDPDVEQILFLKSFRCEPLPNHSSVSVTSAHDWDLGDGCFATKGTFGLVCSNGDRIGRWDEGASGLVEKQFVQRSRYVVSCTQTDYFVIEYWEPGTDSFKVHCQDYRTIIPGGPMMMPKSQNAYGKVLVYCSVTTGDNSLQLWAVDIPKLKLLWTYRCDNWRMQVEGPPMILMHDVHVVLASKPLNRNNCSKVIAILNVNTGEVLSDSQINLPVYEDYPNVSLSLDSVISCGSYTPRIEVARIHRNDIKTQTLKSMFDGGIASFHPSSEGLFSVKIVKTQLSVKFLDALSGQVTQYEVPIHVLTDCPWGEDWLYCIYRSKGGNEKGEKKKATKAKLLRVK